MLVSQLVGEWNRCGLVAGGCWCDVEVRGWRCSAGAAYVRLYLCDLAVALGRLDEGGDFAAAVDNR